MSATAAFTARRISSPKRALARWPLLRNLFSSPRLRDWLYFRARHGTAEEFRRLVRPGQKVVAIGDAAEAGKSKEAIASAFSAALLEHRNPLD